MTIRVRMIPHLDDIGKAESGIMTVVRAYFKHLPKYGIELVGSKSDDFDVLAVHAGMSENMPSSVSLVAHLHGLYWTADYTADTWEWNANKNVIESCRKASRITVPSNWVAETIRRDLRVDPVIVPHGIDWEEWQHKEPCQGYVLGYAKNRAYMDVCDPTYLNDMAKKYPGIKFLATFAPPNAPPNVEVIGVQPHEKMKKIIQRAACVISPLKETWGVLTAEAMASGVPVLGYAHGGNLELIKHQVNGFLAKPGNKDELVQGLAYCLDYRETLGENGREMAKALTWDAACQLLTRIYTEAARPEPPTVSVVIPCYNYGTEEKLGRAIRSVQQQTYPVESIIVVDDGSPDGGATDRLVETYRCADSRVAYIRQDNSGVAVARNRGISHSRSKYIVCLDADDAIAPEFVRACVEELEKDRSLGIAYTGLLQVHPDGHTAVSPWPDKFNYDGMLKKRNSVPTCCVFRREAWERVGGFRQRYAPQGCGSEDADLWLRMGAYGWGAKKVTDAPLFLYSVGQGYVSGNRQYREVDWTSLHPWTKDEQHPFASVATPKRFSHPVRQYDEPVISVIIPVGPGHKSQVFNALDSMEAQTFRKWEVILVDDTGDPTEQWAFDGVPDVIRAYPYARLVATPGKKGAGYARNRGAEAARAPLLVFLDADDNWLSNDALSLMLEAYLQNNAIIYTDYVGKAYISEKEAKRLQDLKRLIHYDEKTGLAMSRHMADDYDCERAVKQPSAPFYIWNLITSLVPKSWHAQVGGFDEHMPSWEDWDYWIRLARAGYCFVRIPEPLVAYRFYTGARRESGIQLHQSLVQYLLQKYEKEKPPMACGCSKKKAVAVPVQAPAQAQGAMAQSVDSSFVMVTYDHPNRGQHRVVGPAVFSEQIAPGMVKAVGGWSMNYGYRAGGDEFLVHKRDIELLPHIFKPVRVAPPVPVVSSPPPAPPEPLPAEEKTFDPQTLPGVTRAIAAEFISRGYDSPDCIIELGLEGLMKIDGIAEKRAKTILNAAKKLAEKMAQT